jgi:DNA polymerase I-like protein with 3'-5' exonuclease and polymerase domains
MVQAAYENPIVCIGVDSEFKFLNDQPVVLPNGDEWRDIRSILPFCIAFVMISGDQLLQFVVDLRSAELLSFVQEVLDLPVPFVAHHARSELFVFWTLGLPEPRTFWDTMLAEMALMLGRSPWRWKSREAKTDEESASLKEMADAEEKSSLSLYSVATRYGIKNPHNLTKSALQSSFLTKPIDEALTEDQIEYNAGDARLTALIRGPQRAACDRAGILETLDRVVMPWNVTVAEMQWDGVLYDRDKCRSLLDGSARVRERLGAELVQLGVSNPNSAAQLAGLLEAAGLGRHFPKTETGRLSTRDSVLEGREHLHPAIPLVRRWRKVRQLASDPAVLGLITGADGRVHAEFNALGADSGRTQARRPNLLGIGRIFRPLVRALAGCGIGEVDLSQIEVGIAAGLFRDPTLIADFNAGDVYAAMAQRIFAAQIPPDDT